MEPGLLATFQSRASGMTVREGRNGGDESNIKVVEKLHGRAKKLPSKKKYNN